MKVASWNVNSIKVRLDHVLAWCARAEPDLLALQETKVRNENFPLELVQPAGYQAVFSGQAKYNGVAILSKEQGLDVVTDPPGVTDDHRRIIAATYGDLRLINLYVVNGQAVGTEKYAYKLDWLRRVTDFVATELARYPRLAVVGDFNIAPQPQDVWDPKAWENRVLFSPPERAALAQLMALGLHDSFRLFEQPEGSYSWWDYRSFAFQRGNRGLRIDLVLVSDPLAQSATGAGIDIEPRRLERPSDHAPVWAAFAA